MSTLSENSLNSNGGSADVSHQTHERPRHERHSHESDNVMSPALCTNGQERAGAARHPIEWLAPISDGVLPSLEPEYLIRSQDNLRGPRAMIKIIVLIVSIFTVPIAYYLWMGGWDPIPRGSTELGSFDSKSIMPPRMPSREDFLPAPRRSSEGILPPRRPASEHIIPPPRPPSEDETSTVRGGDLGTPAKDGLRTAKSSAGETVVMLQPGTPGAQDLASSTAARAFDLPKPSTRQERSASQDDDPPRPAKAEPRTAKSSAGDTVTMLQPRTPAAQDSPSNPVLRALDSEQLKLLMKQGEQFIAAGDVVTARIAFQRAAEAGNAKAAVALGATYDPTALAKLGVVGISADVEKARSWYQRAEKLGSPEAKQRLEVLGNR
jgi:hypothetical protein